MKNIDKRSVYSRIYLSMIMYVYVVESSYGMAGAHWEPCNAWEALTPSWVTFPTVSASSITWQDCSDSGLKTYVRMCSVSIYTVQSGKYSTYNTFYSFSKMNSTIEWLAIAKGVTC